MKIGEITKEISKINPGVVEQVKKDLAFHIGLMVEHARISMGMTQTELAEKINTKQPAIARIENGKSLPSLTVLDKIAKEAFDSYLVPPRFAFMSIDPLFVGGNIILESGIQSGNFTKSPASPYMSLLSAKIIYKE